MAVTKVGKSGNANGAIDYLLKEDKKAQKKPQIIGGNVTTFGAEEEIKEDFSHYTKLKPNVKNQIVHLSVSLKPDEHLDEEKKVEFSEKLLEKTGFEIGKIPYLIVEHHDKDYEHWHIVAGRITSDAETVREWKIAERAIAATKELEREFGLQEVVYTKTTDRQVKRDEYKLMERTEELSVIAEAKIVIDKTLEQKPTTKVFVESMQAEGFEVKPNVSETTGKMSGFAFKKDEIVFKSSAIGKKYSFENLLKNGLDYEPERDKEFLIEIKNSAEAEKSAEPSKSVEVKKSAEIEKGKAENTKIENAKVENTKTEIIKTEKSQIESRETADKSGIGNKLKFEIKPANEEKDNRENEQINQELPVRTNIREDTQSDIQLPAEENIKIFAQPNTPENIPTHEQENIQIPIPTNIQKNTQLPAVSNIQENVPENINTSLRTSILIDDLITVPVIYTRMTEQTDDRITTHLEKEVKTDESAEKSEDERKRIGRTAGNESLADFTSFDGESTEHRIAGVSGINADILEQIGRSQSIAEEGKRTLERAERFVEARTEEFNEGKYSVGGGDSPNEKLTEPVSADEPKFSETDVMGATQGRFIEDADTSFGDTYQANYDDYFDFERSSYYSEESSIQFDVNSRLFIADDSGIADLAKITSEIQANQNELFKFQSGINQSRPQGYTGEIQNNSEGIETTSIDSNAEENLRYFDKFLTEQMTTIVSEVKTNQEALNMITSEFEKSNEELLRINIEFRMTEPEIEEPEQDAEELEQNDDYDYEEGYSFSL